MILDLMSNSSKNNKLAHPRMFKFVTNAKEFKINFDISNKVTGNFPHVGISAREGLLVLYKYPEDKSWLNVEVFTKRSQTIVNMSHLIKDDKEYSVIIYGPILSRLSSLNVELDDSFFAKFVEPVEQKSICVAGGINTFGIGCTTVGSMFSNIIGRKFNINVNNIAYNNKNYLEELYNFYQKNTNIPYFDIGILEVDYINQNDDIVEKYLNKVVNLMKQHCNYLICWFSIPISKEYKIQKIYELLHGPISKGSILIENISYIHDLEYYDMCTYSENFINDAGNIMIYKKLNETIKKVLKWNI